MSADFTDFMTCYYLRTHSDPEWTKVKIMAERLIGQGHNFQTLRAGRQIV